MSKNVLVPQGARPGEFPGTEDVVFKVEEERGDIQPDDIGVWLYDYKKGLCFEREASPLAYAMDALKNELLFNGSTRILSLGTRCLGSNFGNAVRDFQSSHGLTPDGDLGYRTAKKLFFERVRQAAADERFPSSEPGPRLLHGLLDLESNMDPAATGPSPDEGIAQIVRRFHGVSEEQAYDPSFAIPWAAARVRDYKDQIGSWQAGCVAYNIGVTRAREWHNAGLPEEGGIPIIVGFREDGTPIVYPLYEWATLYWSVTKKRAVNY